MLMLCYVYVLLCYVLLCLCFVMYELWKHSFTVDKKGIKNMLYANILENLSWKNAPSKRFLFGIFRRFWSLNKSYFRTPGNVYVQVCLCSGMFMFHCVYALSCLCFAVFIYCYMYVIRAHIVRTELWKHFSWWIWKE